MKRVLWCLRIINYKLSLESHISFFPGKSRNLLFITDNLCLEIPDKTGYRRGRWKQKDLGLDSFLSKTLWFHFGWEHDSWLPMVPQHARQSCWVRHAGRQENDLSSRTYLLDSFTSDPLSIAEPPRQHANGWTGSDRGPALPVLCLQQRLSASQPKPRAACATLPPSPTPASLPPAIFSSRKSCWPFTVWPPQVSRLPGKLHAPTTLVGQECCLGSPLRGEPSYHVVSLQQTAVRRTTTFLVPAVRDHVSQGIFSDLYEKSDDTLLICW